VELTSSYLPRQCKKQKYRQPCFICGKYQAITEAHHVLPLKEAAHILNRVGGAIPEPPIVWLCPNCHTNVHQNMAMASSPALLRRYFEILEMRNTYLESLILRWLNE